MEEVKQPEGFTLVSKALGGLPIINSVMDRLRLPELLANALPAIEGRVKLAPAVLVRVMVANLVLGREPLYGLGEWAARFDPALLGLAPEKVPALNDDRAGRALEALFDADRGSLLTSVVLRAISGFGIDTGQLHNDSTSISVQGAYRGADGSPHGGKATPVITFGHSKDHQPDLKQLVWILTVSSDGAVPVAYRLADGNTGDDPTHVPTWNGLAALLGRTDFLYVADSKLCSRHAMDHINGRGGRFVTVLPRSRSKDKLSGARCRTKTRGAAEKAATLALANAHADRWVTATLTEQTEKSYRQDGRGRPGPGTRYKEITTSRFSVTADIDLEHIRYDAASDGCFPLITNDHDLTNTQVLAAYKYQPNLERRHHLLKSVQNAAPILLRDPARIEALFCCQFLALLICALIEREARNGMRQAGTPKIALYPEFRDCTAPSTERILEIFAPVSRHQLYRHGALVQEFAPELTDQQRQILGLLDLAPTIYTKQKQHP